MLFNITSVKISDVDFERHIEKIKLAYFDTNLYREILLSHDNDLKAKLRKWHINGSDHKDYQILKQLELILRDRRKKYYTLIDGDNGDTSLELPFIHRFHIFFLKRRWNCPDIKDEALYWLTADPAGENCNHDNDFNGSKNCGNFMHFVNVVMATARLIALFSSKTNLQHCLLRREIQPKNPFVPGESIDGISSSSIPPQLDELIDRLYFRQDYTFQKFILMIAAFYHDLGKTVVDHRHGMEGAILLSEHVNSSWKQFQAITHCYGDRMNNEIIRKEEILFIADMLDFHDLFGTLSTGETSYLKAADLVAKVKKYSAKHEHSNGEASERIAWIERYVFYNWLLNLADILVSKDAGQKYKFQSQWMVRADAEDYIVTFFENDRQAGDLVHDLLLTLKIARNNSRNLHEEELSSLYTEAYDLSKRHSVEHIRRLIRTSITSKTGYPRNANQRYLKFRESILNQLESRHILNSIIVRSIQSVTDFNNFCKAFSWVGQMDYALGFFSKIAEAALEKTEDEIKNPDSRQKTKLISDKTPNRQFGDELQETIDFYLEMQASLLLDNFTMIVIEILNYLISRERPFDRARNLEFNEASTRLTVEKIDAILAIDGAYNYKRSIRQILQTVFLY